MAKLQQIKNLEGDRGKQKKVELETVNAPELKDLTPPEQLPPESKAFWINNIQSFIALGVLKSVDVVKFAAYCHACAQYLKLTKELSDQGSELLPGTNNIDQRVYLAGRHLDTMYKLGALFGDNPQSRLKLAIKKEDKSDPVQAFLTPMRMAE